MFQEPLSAVANTPLEILSAHQLEMIFSGCDTLLNHHSILLLALEKSCDGSRTLQLSPDDQSSPLERRKTSENPQKVLLQGGGGGKSSEKSEGSESSTDSKKSSDQEKPVIEGEAVVLEHEEQEEEDELDKSQRLARNPSDNRMSIVVEPNEIPVETPPKPVEDTSGAQDCPNGKETGEAGVLTESESQPTSVQDAKKEGDETLLPEEREKFPPENKKRSHVGSLVPLPPVPSIATAFVSMVEGMRGPYTKYPPPLFFSLWLFPC